MRENAKTLATTLTYLLTGVPVLAVRIGHNEPGEA